MILTYGINIINSYRYINIKNLYYSLLKYLFLVLLFSMNRYE